MALLLLSLVIVLGILHNTSVVKNADLGLPRFVLVALHRNLSLITVVFIALHVITILVTDYVHLRVVDVFVPGIALYNPIGAALGTVATDVVLAIILTSVLRKRVSRRVWFWVHWTSYLCWPVAVAHAVLNVSFSGTTWWTLVVPLISLIAIIWALLYRVSDQRRVAVPVAERGKVPDEAIQVMTGELPLPARRGASSPYDDAVTETIAPPGRHRSRDLDPETEVLRPVDPPRKVVPLAPKRRR